MHRTPAGRGRAAAPGLGLNPHFGSPPRGDSRDGAAGAPGGQSWSSVIQSINVWAAAAGGGAALPPFPLAQRPPLLDDSDGDRSRTAGPPSELFADPPPPLSSPVGRRLAAALAAGAAAAAAAAASLVVAAAPPSLSTVSADQAEQRASCHQIQAHLRLSATLLQQLAGWQRGGAAGAAPRAAEAANPLQYKWQAGAAAALELVTDAAGRCGVGEAGAPPALSRPSQQLEADRVRA
jgi:hypothetical protein